MKKSYNKKDYKKFVKLWNESNLRCFNIYKRKDVRMKMSEFLKGFTKDIRVKMFERDNKEHNYWG